NPQNITNDPADDYGLFMCRPSWSPDGRMIAFVSKRDGNDHIYVMDANGNNQRKITDSPDGNWFPAWSPDGQMIAFVFRQPDGDDDILVMDVNGKKLKNLTESNPMYDRGPAWSPDGKKIAFQSSRIAGMGIHIMDVDGGNPIRLTNIDSEETHPDWFDPAFAYKAVTPIDRLMSTWGWIKQGSEY
ncbi:TPA: hypothetical protein ENS27_17015, partial [bacterium]|nr:hypothetical protein [bacterium]